MFSLKVLLILPKFHETSHESFMRHLSRSGDIKIFRPGRRMYMYTLPPFMDEILSEERQIMKWVGIFQVGIFCVEIFLKEIFLEPLSIAFLFTDNFSS